MPVDLEEDGTDYSYHGEDYDCDVGNEKHREDRAHLQGVAQAQALAKTSQYEKLLLKKTRSRTKQLKGYFISEMGLVNFNKRASERHTQKSKARV